ncbi:phosphatidylserine decarboxylase [Altererythrobacter sp. RZ02]|uniref:Phosphatidylserine decarboxylase proenzyme n=1 Tax=Pontixanthobacter rizhaonensis TaxID=2730337 RepID=A0A848QPB1_9SPHN|nr:archaetidylserine decarboxylase [Pontixanthobacter rizhaonensis]NMW32447.1 phosphatidylserine decarboxylase [Pontixanthobacter rizhaonensis]
MFDRLFIWLQYILPQHGLSKLAGAVARSERPWLRDRLIGKFIQSYKVNMAEAERPEGQYRNFNDFFTRALKPDARPLADATTSVLCPADGAVSQIGSIEDGRIFQAKGQSYSAVELLGGDAELAQRFEGGNFATIYLSPSDYHRVHMAAAGTLESTTYVPGDLFSVNTVTAENVPRLFARNERLSSVFATPRGAMASVMVGAMIVASIETVWGGLVTPHQKRVATQTFGSGVSQPQIFEAGDEMGRFLLGSTVILLFEPGAMAWDDALVSGSVVRMGQALGTWL